MSWEDIENEEAPKDAFEGQIEKFSSLCYQTFELNAPGQELIKLLNAHYETPVCPPNKDPSYGFFREGQNNIIRQFKNGIEFHKKNSGGKL